MLIQARAKPPLLLLLPSVLFVIAMAFGLFFAAEGLAPATATIGWISNGALAFFVGLQIRRRLLKPVIFEADDEGVRAHGLGRTNASGWKELTAVRIMRSNLLLRGENDFGTPVLIAVPMGGLDVSTREILRAIAARRPDLCGALAARRPDLFR